MMKYLVEFMGTFVFLSVILTTGKALPIVTALYTAVQFGGNVSGGHFNPAVSTMMALKGDLSQSDFPAYVVAQIAGGIAALYFVKQMKASQVEALSI